MNAEMRCSNGSRQRCWSLGGRYARLFEL